ncbi:hypothetical protein B0T10DRAFT_602547 [Thelonectria olida]|uniref:Uncharacterized protein n=1 Tax=Thelonectria olida TaxID=1576542 RepID=A0A9P8WEP4_9HYPO|nr:hypothetical protein B0T10DRAFT_602547 [Thelonectria olida]
MLSHYMPVSQMALNYKSAGYKPFGHMSSGDASSMEMLHPEMARTKRTSGQKASSHSHDPRNSKHHKVHRKKLRIGRSTPNPVPKTLLSSSTPIHPARIQGILSELSESMLFSFNWRTRTRRAPNIVLVNPPAWPHRLKGFLRREKKPFIVRPVEVKIPDEFSIAQCLASIGCAAGGVGVAFVDVEKPEERHYHEYLHEQYLDEDEDEYDAVAEPPVIVVTPPEEDNPDVEMWWDGYILVSAVTQAAAQQSRRRGRGKLNKGFK